MTLWTWNDFISSLLSFVRPFLHEIRSFLLLSHSIDEMLESENASMAERLYDLERQVLEQQEEILSLKSTLAEVLRRLNNLDCNSSRISSSTSSSSSYETTIKNNRSELWLCFNEFFALGSNAINSLLLWHLQFVIFYVLFWLPVLFTFICVDSKVWQFILLIIDIERLRLLLFMRTKYDFLHIYKISCGISRSTLNLSREKFIVFWWAFNCWFTFHRKRDEISKFG